MENANKQELLAKIELLEAISKSQTKTIQAFRNMDKAQRNEIRKQENFIANLRHKLEVETAQYASMKLNFNQKSDSLNKLKEKIKEYNKKNWLYRILNKIEI